jgi:hypothetical protein
MTSESEPSRAAGDDWRADARAAVAHLADAAQLPPAVAAALRGLDAALRAGDDVAGLASDVAWPAITETAQVHGTVFKPGTSAEEVVAAAIRYYQFEQQPPRVASRTSVLDRFGAQVGALTNPGALDDSD